MNNAELLEFCKSIACATDNETGISLWLNKCELKYVKQTLKNKKVKFTLVDMVKVGDVSIEDVEDGEDRYRIDIDYADQSH